MSQTPATQAPVDLAASMQHRHCPVCGHPASEGTLFLERSLDETRLTATSFASRKAPEFMSYHLVVCGICSVVFAAEAPSAGSLATAYHQADFGTADEATYAARTYLQTLTPSLAKVPHRGIALEIGTGTGVFLSELRAAGFAQQVGIEPSPAAIAQATPADRACIREGIFTGDEFPPGTVSLIACFMTLEHVADPAHLVRSAYRMLEPGGMLALVTHDYTAPLNRLLGRRSPIIDIEHLQLFNPASLRRLVTDAGFAVEHLAAIRNVYPLGYWTSLLPLPGAARRGLASIMAATGLGRRPVGVNVGNLLTVAQKGLAEKKD